MKLDSNLKAAIGDFKLRWENEPPSRCERIVVERLESSGMAWNAVVTEKGRYEVPIDHVKVLQFVVDSFRVVEGEVNKPTLKETQNKFAKIDDAFNTLTSFYEDYPESEHIRLVHRLRYQANIVREFEIGDAIQFPIVKKPKLITTMR